MQLNVFFFYYFSNDKKSGGTLNNQPQSFEQNQLDWEEDLPNSNILEPNKSNTSESFHRLTISDKNIIIVDTRDKFYKMLRYLSVQYFIAFDSEWKPTFCATNEVALIQLASHNHIYLIDVITLSIRNDDWNRLGKCLFNNNEILKIGKQ